MQTWVTELGQQRSPELVAKCYQLTAAVLKSAVPDRLITFNPCDGVRLPRRRKQDHHGRVISQDELLTKLLPAAPERYRGLLATAASFKLFPKSAAGRRTVPSLGWLKFCRSTTKPIRRETPNAVSKALRCTLFRSRVWRPALVRAGLLGTLTLTVIDDATVRAGWTDATGATLTKELPTEREAVLHIARWHAGGLRFHDLGRSYATWLVDDGVPPNMVARVMGHEKITTTLQLYTHRTDDEPHP